MPQQPARWPGPPRQPGPSHLSLPPQPVRRPAHLSPKKPLQSQQRTRKRISYHGPLRPLQLLVTTPCLPGSLAISSLWPFPRTDQAGWQEVPSGQGRPGLLFMEAPSVHLSPCVFSHLTLPPSTTGNHGDADWALQGAGQGRGRGPLWDACGHPSFCPSSPDPLLPDHRPLTV